MDMTFKSLRTLKSDSASPQTQGAQKHMSKIDKALQQQIELNRAKNMLYVQLGQIIEIDPDFLAALEELVANGEKPLPEPVLQNAISFASETLIKRLYSINQFIQITEQKSRSLENIYQHTWQRIVETKNIQAALKDYHYSELASWIASLYPKSFVKSLRDLPTIGHIICEEYSPQLQIDLLRLDIPTLRQPVLDVGCGSTAGLTRHLRTLGIEAYGIDRQIEKREAYLQQTGWMDYEFERDTWGTIISNMAFTNHLHYINFHDPAQLEPYLQKFKEMIEALTIGGSFYYAPSVPFIEDRLGTNRYRVERFGAVGKIHMTRITKIAK